MPARFFTRINNILLDHSKLLIFVCLLLTLFSIPQLVFAQTATQVTSTNVDGTYNNFNTLFDLPAKKATLTFGKKIDGSLGFSADLSRATNAADLIYRFDGAFDIKPGASASDFWTLIADFTGSRKNFVLRLCDIGDDGKLIDNIRNCWFTEYPSETDMYFDIDTRPYTTQEEFTKLRAAQLNKKIYHYDASWQTDTTGAIDARASEISVFGVEYQPTSFSYFNANGDLVQGNKDLLPGKTYQADLWYCVAGDQKFPAGDRAKLDTLLKTDNIRVFPTLCDGDHLAYIRMAGIKFTVPANQQQLADISGSGQTTSQNTTGAPKIQSDDVLPQCAWFWGSGSFVGCLAKGVYYLIYRPIAWIALMFGKLFDFFLGYTISDEAYRMDFAVKGWQIIRDISNIFFILILVYTGLMAVFNTDGVSMKKVVPQLILNALLINFSLFATRVVIDISNVVSRIFYNVMDVRDQSGKERFLGNTGYKSVSEGVVATFDPQKVFKAEYLAPGGSTAKDCRNAPSDDAECLKQNGDSTSFGAQDIQNSVAASRSKDTATAEYAGFFIIVSLLAALIMATVITMFWKTSFFFLGRTVGLYIVMIFSPFAFLTRGNMPIVGGIKQLKWSDWVKELTDYATLAPVFMFFLYLIYLLMKSGFTTLDNPNTFIETVISVGVPMLIVYFFLTYGVKIAKQYAGFVGNMVQEKVSGVAGAVAGLAAGGALGLASGGLGLLGRGVGATASTVQNKTALGSWINRTQTKGGLVGWTARQSNAALEKTKAASFDPRNNKFAMSQLQNILPVKLQADNKILNALDLSSKKTAGGYGKYQERKNKEQKEQIEKVETKYSDDDAKKFYTDLLSREFQESLKPRFEEEAKKELQKEKEAGTISGFTVSDIDKRIKEKQKKWEAENEEDAKKAKEEFEKETRKKFGTVKDNKTLTQAMRLRYAENLAANPDSSWDYVRAIAGVPVVSGDIFMSMSANKKAAEKYLKDTRKNFKGIEKNANELVAIEEKLNEVLENMATVDPTTYGGYKTKGKYDYKEMDSKDLNEMLKRRRADLEAELEAHDLDLDEIRQAYKKASGKTKENLKKQYATMAKKKADVKEEVDELKNILRRKDQSQEKVDGKGKDEKKEDKKPEEDKK